MNPWPVILGYLVTIVLGLLGIAFGVSTLVGVGPFAPPPTQEYVIGFGGSVGTVVPIVLTAECAEQPTSHDTKDAVCDMTDIHAYVVTPEQWDALKMGSPFPS